MRIYGRIQGVMLHLEGFLSLSDGQLLRGGKYLPPRLGVLPPSPKHVLRNVKYL